MARFKLPAPAPCVSCPYRRDVPSGVWAAEEYAKLPPYDNETGYQPPNLFGCHQQNGRLCAGWVGCHDMENNLGMRLAPLTGSLTPEEVEECCDYQVTVPLFASGAEAAEHGMANVDEPGYDATLMVVGIQRKQRRRVGVTDQPAPPSV